MVQPRICPFIRECSMKSNDSDVYFHQIECMEERCMAWGYINNEKDIEGCKLIEKQILVVQIK